MEMKSMSTENMLYLIMSLSGAVGVMAALLVCHLNKQDEYHT